MNRIFLDFKKLILGQDNSEEMPLDFKEEVAVSLKTSIIDKARASLLMLSINNVDKLGKDIDKKQIADVSGKGERVSKDQVKNKVGKKVEEVKQEIKKENIKKKEQEKEEKKKKEESLRQTLQRIAEQDELAENKKFRQKRRLEIIFCRDDFNSLSKKYKLRKYIV